MCSEQNQLLSVRYIPEDWIHPLNMQAVFGKPARPLEVDIGSGRGRFLLARARSSPDTCLLGIERLLARVDLVERMIKRADLSNVRLLYADASYTVRYLLPRDSVRAFFILFSDPWPKQRHTSKRLIQPEFVKALAQALEPDGVVHVASDFPPAIKEAAALFNASPVFAQIDPWAPKEEERTDYEVKYMALNRTITRLSYQKLKPSVAP